MKKLLMIFLMVAFIPIHAGTTRASVRGPAEIISPVNLRQGPGLDSAVISVLQQGQKVTVLDMRSNWLMVSVDGDTYGFRGWVYGDYLVRLAPSDPPVVPSRPADNPREETSTGGGTEMKIPVEAASGKPASIISEENPSTVQTAAGAGFQKSNEIPAQPDNRPAGRSITTVQENVSPQPLEPPAAAPIAMKQTAIPPDTHSMPLRQEAASLRRPETSRAAVEAESVNTYSFPFVGLVLKLSMVLFCCISLIFSAKAYLTAKEARRVPT